MDCVFGLVAVLGAVLGTVIGAIVGYVSDPEHEPSIDVFWFLIVLVVVPVAAVYVGIQIASAFNSLVRRFRPPGEADLLSHDATGSNPPAVLAVVLGLVVFIVPAFVASAMMFVATRLLS